MHASHIEATSLTVKDTSRLSACLNKTLGLHCFDFRRARSKREICEKSNIRSFKSLRKLYDAKMLFKFVTHCENFSLTMRLTSRSVFFLRFPSRIAFSDLSRKSVGMNSFRNRAQKICEMIPFEWLDMLPTMHVLNLKREWCHQRLYEGVKPRPWARKQRLS